mgnify:CR=1 FL=1|tara:strand:+ start:1179 stop:2231 length:1053 start_codon:yes stop_codon:yes gene_type:complete
MGITGQKGLWAVNSRINQLEKSEGNIMHDDLTSTGDRVQNCNDNSLTFTGSGVDPAVSGYIRMVENAGKYNVRLGSAGASDYVFPDAAGVNNQVLQLQTGSGDRLLNWVDLPAGSSLGPDDQTLTADRTIYTSDDNLTFKNDALSPVYMRISAANSLEIGDIDGGSSYKFPTTSAGGSIPKVLTQTNSGGTLNFMYSWNTLGIPGTGNHVWGINAMAGYGEGSGEDNIVIGDDVAPLLSAGSDNIIIGANTAPALTSGVENIIIGDAAGGVTATGQQNIIIGGDSRCGGNTDSRSIMIGMGDIGTAGSELRFGASLNPVSTITTQTIVSDTTIKIFINGTAYDFLVKPTP